MIRNVRAVDARSPAWTGRSARPNQPSAAATARSTAAIRNTWYGLSHTNSTPPAPKPAICMTPTLAFIVERPSTYAPGGSMSLIRAQRAPLVIEPTYAVPKMMVNRAHSGRPGTAWSAAPAVAISAARVNARRGGRLSAADSRVRLPITPAIGAPNMLSAVSRAESVAA
ncbi:hypothetical protein ACNAW0_30350 [Micromonospora sp. SL1-18]|uniref:hypothetical protein n=1 Tax=Micromonospora sp. SL1-18 TaxID=3399128 RepID=UPI003A4D412B